ncbi:MAG: IS1380 family transposase, partial [Candidatus Aminicenantes bacterium]|nr:IS1380 family transposase [Candidatus Aminicenantes bacterium]
MSQGLLPYKYEIEKREGGLTALGGVGLYLDMFRALKLGHILDSSIGIRDSDQGYMDRQIGLLLILLNIVGGDCVEDLERLEQDDGFCRLWEK